MNVLNTRFNKANWSAALSAVVVLINGRLPEKIALSAEEQGLLMIILTFAVVTLVPNASASAAKGGS